MTTAGSETSNAQEQDQQPKTRGGASPEDKSKGLDTGQDGPFNSAGSDTAESKRGAKAGQTS